ncbi:hypothetical protein [Streptacidiphilus jiangxiensis]|uniref:WXG100 family type VII secretion target n=1 Tax=Streptacidiphilus jiangxiensis TaxID=235985 RepID=A0A1H7S5G0_STRJI|nr:hypothetical protein [Streptacidiphilus jiangxiensis]SEL66974.1 hypothetical protein SAMN05414137_111127 [Streptacidiphilus jiangxiensis]
MDGFRAPSAGDFGSYEGLVGHQSDHLARLGQWSSGQCSNTQGFDEGLLLLPMLAVVPELGQFFDGKLAQATRGMHLIAGKVHETSAEYTRTDQDNAAGLRSLYPSAFSGGTFGNYGIGDIPGAGAVANFTDEPVEPKEPASAQEDEAKGIKHALLLVRQQTELKFANTLFQWCTGQSLYELLLTPLLGDFGRLRYLSDAYGELSDGLYTVAGTLRKGSWKLGSEWQGATANAFDQYLFMWTMGIGGIGDAAKDAAEAYKIGYDTTVRLARMALKQINQLVKDEIAQLATQAEEMLAGDAAVEAVGGGPEDPVADVVAAGFSIYKLYKIYKIVHRIITGINAIITIFRAIEAAVKDIETAVHKIMAAIDSPMPSIGSLIDQVEQRGFDFEKNGGWSPVLGAGRIAMLPAA